MGATTPIKMFPTDLTNPQWQVIAAFIADKRKRKYSLRKILNALLYLNKTGCQWRMLPSKYPPWQSCVYYFRKWTRNGTLERLNTELVKLRRRSGGRDESPTIVIIDSQSIKCSEVGVEQTGFDGGKKVKGRKRHLIVDALGLVLAVSVSAANVHDSKGALGVVRKLFCQGHRKINKIVADGGYKGGFVKWAKRCFEWTIEITVGLKGEGFHPIPLRWKIERTIAWMNWSRRLAKDYECTTSSSESMIYLSNIQRIIDKI
jgi:putative transposase